MDSNCSRKRRGGGGFIKGKLRSLYRASSIKVKPSPGTATDHGGSMTMMMNQQKSNTNMISATQYYNKVVPTTTTTTSTAASSVGSTVVVNQDHHLPKHITTATSGGDCYNAARMDVLPSDETVDHKAAEYISSVLERFKREYVN